MIPPTITALNVNETNRSEITVTVSNPPSNGHKYQFALLRSNTDPSLDAANWPTEYEALADHLPPDGTTRVFGGRAEGGWYYVIGRTCLITGILGCSGAVRSPAVVNRAFVAAINDSVREPVDANDEQVLAFKITTPIGGVTLTYELGGTATIGHDYRNTGLISNPDPMEPANSYQIAFSDTERSKTISLRLRNDYVHETDESVEIVLRGPLAINLPG